MKIELSFGKVVKLKTLLGVEIKELEKLAEHELTSPNSKRIFLEMIEEYQEIYDELKKAIDNF